MKTYVFIGASSGIATEAAKQLISQGNKVIGISRGDVSNIYTIGYTIENYKDAFPELDIPIDGLVYFPGSIQLKPFHRISADEMEKEFEINFFGAVHSIQYFLPLLKKSEQASVVLFSSVAAQVGMTFHASIAAAKGAIEALTRSLAAEYAPTIRFNAVAPSLTNTALAERLLGSDEKILNAGQRHPLKRIGTAADSARAVCFLLSNEASWTTGQVLHIDGGLSTLR